MVAREWPRPESPEDKSALGALVDEKRMADNVSALQQEHIEYLSNDPLTGLKNRGSFDSSFEQAVKLVRRGMKASVISIDVDHFKKVNDTFGHSAGDEVLRQLGTLIKGSIRDVDIAGRIGGEELMVLLSGADISIAAKKAEELRVKIEKLVFDSYPGLTVTASFGVIALDGSTDAEKAKKLVDVELYKAKHGGRNRVEVQGMENIS